jgi:hypothetical protein
MPATLTIGKLEWRRAQLEKSVARCLAQLDTAELHEPSEELATKTAHLKEKLVNLESEMQPLAARERLMLGSPDHQISLTDHDSRSGDARADILINSRECPIQVRWPVHFNRLEQQV